jgi:hypothetical protein
MYFTDYKKIRKAILRIQALLRGARFRLAYLRKRRATIVFQAYTRGWAARELYKELKAKKKAEEEKKRQQEREKREREAREKGETLMEESFLQAQKELFAMARQAEIKAAEIVKPAKDPSTVSLDSMFTYLGQTISKASKDEGAILALV